MVQKSLGTFGVYIIIVLSFLTFGCNGGNHNGQTEPKDVLLFFDVVDGSEINKGTNIPIRIMVCHKNGELESLLRLTPAKLGEETGPGGHSWRDILDSRGKQRYLCLDAVGKQDQNESLKSVDPAEAIVIFANFIDPAISVSGQVGSYDKSDRVVITASEQSPFADAYEIEVGGNYIKRKGSYYQN